MRIHNHNISLLKNNTIKIELDKHTTSLIKFKDENMYTLFESLISKNVYERIDVLGTCHINTFGGDESP